MSAPLSRLAIAVLLTACAPAVTWAFDTSAWRWSAQAGPAELHDDYLDAPVGLAIAMGLEFSDHPWARLGARWDLTVFEAQTGSFSITGLMLTLRVMPVPEAWRVRPYGLYGSGFATPPTYTGAYPFGAQYALGVQYDLPGGRELFIEHCWLHGRDVVAPSLRLGITFP